EAGLNRIAAHGVEESRSIEAACALQAKTPPVLIVVCDNTEIAEVFLRKISGEREEEVVDAANVDDETDEQDDDASGRRRKKTKRRTVYGQGEVFPDHLSNTPMEKRTIRIDSRLLAEV